MIDNLLLHYQTKSAFESDLENDLISDTSIVFIKETKEIWTHGVLYNASSIIETDEEIIAFAFNKLNELIQSNSKLIQLNSEQILSNSELIQSVNKKVDNLDLSYSKLYLTIESLADNNTISWEGDAKTISVSTDDGNIWVEKTGTSEGTPLATLNSGQKLLIKGTINYGGSWTHFTSSNRYNVYGNIMSLLYSDDFLGKIDLTNKEYIFSYLFSDSFVVNANHLILPATTLSDGCYQYMFDLCPDLITAPELPATLLAASCYEGMFSRCSSLTTAPKLPATTLVTDCYSYMFQYCSNLNYVNAMFITNSGSDLLKDWLDAVAEGGVFIKNNRATWSDAKIPPTWTIYTESEVENVKKYELSSELSKKLNKLASVGPLYLDASPSGEYYYLKTGSNLSRITGILDTNDFLAENDGGWFHAGVDTTLATIGVLKHHFYEKPSSGIPKSDLSSNLVQELDQKLYFTNDGGDLYITDGSTSVTYANKTVEYDVNYIKNKIPDLASETNKLADKDFVNSSITTATANLRGTVNDFNDLGGIPADNNDYAFVITTDNNGNTVYKRYKYNGITWEFEYDLNNSSFTAAQWAAIQSGITQALVTKLSGLPDRASLESALDAKVDKVTGKGLSTNDYTNDEKTKLAMIPKTKAYDNITVSEFTAGIPSSTLLPKLKDLRSNTDNEKIVYIKGIENYIPFNIKTYGSSFEAYFITDTENSPTVVYVTADPLNENWFITKTVLGNKVTQGNTGDLVALDANNNFTDAGIPTNQVVTSTTVKTLQKLTQAEFDALTTYDANTEYNII